MAVSMEIIVRMKQFLGYPTALCLMSKRWFPAGAAAGNVHRFLATDPSQLDVGAGLQLHTYAWQCGTTEVAAAAWLLSPPVQELFDQLAEVLISHSLAAERRHAEVKQWEGSKFTHIAAASRNAIATRYLR